MRQLRLPDSPGWKSFFKSEIAKPYFESLMGHLQQEIEQGLTLYPGWEHLFQAFIDVPLEQVSVVILGQDPYHAPGQALGRSFAVPNPLLPKPPSLLNLYREIETDLGVTLDRHQSDLSGWASQGVLLLNTLLTVRAHEPLSHRSIGWEILTDGVLRLLASGDQPRVFMLWGTEARKKAELIRSASMAQNHLILEAAHPSPLSAYRGFLGCKHFSKANSFLSKPVNWTQLSRPC